MTCTVGLPRRPLGRTGLQVSALGLACGRLGDPALSPHDAEALVLGAVDAGVTLLETGRGDAEVERRLGDILHGARRRPQVVLAARIGPRIGAAAAEGWRAAAVGEALDAALRRLRTDHLDLALLDGCPAEALAAGEAAAALAAAVRAGKLRAAGYAGDNHELDAALATGAFAVVQSSLNLFDQRSVAAIERARRAGIGVLAKRPVASAPWRFDTRPVGDASEAYWVRWRGLALDPGALPWDELALRFAAHFPGVASALVGTRRLERVRRNLEVVGLGPLPAERFQAIRARFEERGFGWPGRA